LPTSGTTTRTIAILLLTIVVTFGAYYFIYLEQHDRAIAQDHLRVLLNAGNAASDAIEGLQGTFSNSVKVDSADVLAGIAAEGKKHEDWITATGRVIDQKLGLIPHLRKRVDPEIGNLDVEQFLAAKGVVSQLSVVHKDVDFPRLRLGVALDARGNDLQLVFLSQREFAKGKPKLPRAWQADLREIFVPALPLGSFEGFLLARSNGDVLFAAGDSPLQLQRLPFPTPSPKAVVRDSIPGSQIFDLRVAGDSYRFFIQPIPIPILLNAPGPPGTSPAWQLDRYWYLAGYTPTTRYRFSTMAIAPTTVLIVLGLVTLGLLGLPLLKIRFLGPLEALRQVDVLLLALSILIGSAFFTFALLFFSMTQQHTRSNVRELTALGEAISDGLEDDLDAADSALVKIEKDRRKEDRGSLRDTIFSSGGLPADSTGKARKSVVSERAIRHYPFVEALTWIDSTGMQKSKWTIRNATTPLVSVSDRAYFRLARDGLLWPATRESDSVFEPGRVVESIRSKGDNREFAVLARRREGPTPVATLEARLPTLFGPILPPETGFAVIDVHGDVQFHSNPERNLRENFFDELGSDEAIRTAVGSRQAVFEKTSYHTRLALVRCSPILRTPWSLVVFKNLGPEQTSSLHILAVALFFLATHFMLFLLLATWIFFKRKAPPHPGERRRLWYWPEGRYEDRYRQLVVVLTGIGGIALLFVCLGSPPAALGGGLLVALSALVLFHLGLRGNDAAPPTDAFSTRWRTSYVAMMTAMAILVGVLPAIGYWRVAYDDGSLARLKSQELELADALNSRRLQRLDWYRDVFMRHRAFVEIDKNVRPISSDSCRSGTARLGFYTASNWSWQYAASYESLHCNAPLLVERLSQELSLHGLSVPSVAAGHAGADSAVVWCRADDGTLALAAVAPTPVGNLSASARWETEPRFRWLQIRAQPESFGLPGNASFWLFAWIAFVGLVWAVRSAVHFTFLEPLEAPLLDGPGQLRGDSAARHALLLRFPLPDDLKKLCFVIGIDRLRHVEKTSDLLSAYKWSRRDRILLTEFEEGLREPEIIQRKVELLEGIRASDAKFVYIESSVEPLHFLLARFHDHFDERAKLGIAIDRWASALEDYRRLRECSGTMAWFGSERVPAEFLHTTLPNVTRDASSDTRSPVDVLDLLQPLYRRLWASCSSAEKLLLYRIAREGFVNRHAREILHPLFRRGLVTADPNWRIVNDSFREFVTVAEEPDVISKWQSRGGTSPWSRMKTPILASVAVLGIFFFTTQREALNQSLGLLAAMTASIPGLVNLVIGSLNRLGASPSKS